MDNPHQIFGAGQSPESNGNPIESNEVEQCEFTWCDIQLVQVLEKISKYSLTANLFNYSTNKEHCVITRNSLSAKFAISE